MIAEENQQQNHRVSPVRIPEANADGHAKRDTNMIDLNIKPHKLHEQSSNNQVRVAANPLCFFNFISKSFFGSEFAFHVDLYKHKIMQNLCYKRRKGLHFT